MKRMTILLASLGVMVFAFLVFIEETVIQFLYSEHNQKSISQPLKEIRENKASDVAPGQIWVYIMGQEDNPFHHPTIFSSNKIIAVKNGWVQYETTYTDCKLTEISENPIKYFVRNMKRVK